MPFDLANDVRDWLVAEVPLATERFSRLFDFVVACSWRHRKTWYRDFRQAHAGVECGDEIAEDERERAGSLPLPGWGGSEIAEIRDAIEYFAGGNIAPVRREEAKGHFERVSKITQRIGRRPYLPCFDLAERRCCDWAPHAIDRLSLCQRSQVSGCTNARGVRYSNDIGISVHGLGNPLHLHRRNLAD